MNSIFADQDITNLDGPKCRRLPVERPVFIKLSNGKAITAKIVSMSMYGLGIVFSAPGEIGAQLDINFLLHVYRRQFHIKARTRVVHCHLKQHAFYTMLEFIDISNDDLYVIEEFLEEKSIFFPIAA